MLARGRRGPIRNVVVREVLRALILWLGRSSDPSTAHHSRDRCDSLDGFGRLMHSSSERPRRSLDMVRRGRLAVDGREIQGRSRQAVGRLLGLLGEKIKYKDFTIIVIHRETIVFSFVIFFATIFIENKNCKKLVSFFQFS